MSNLEIKRLELQLAQVEVSRKANEFRVLELHEAIARLEKDIEISRAKESELLNLIKEKESKEVK